MIIEKLGMIIAAGGSGSRFSKTVNKLLVEYNNKPLIVHALSTFLPVISPGSLVVAAPADLLETMRQTVNEYLPDNQIVWTVGGATRLASIVNAFKLLPDDLKLLAIHDAARPLATVKLLHELCNEALIHGGAIPGSMPSDTIKVIDENHLITGNLIRRDLAAVATPQVFDYSCYKKALSMLPEAVLTGVCEDPQLTDDAALFNRGGFAVKVLFSSDCNFKVTVRSDLKA
ncbi:MAG: hypothetical protein E7052_03415 [Lentisphaerae bacterium]|nr:hypothetical protein [Lentisphaerota bacterium]